MLFACLINQTFGCFGLLHTFEWYIYVNFFAQKGCKHFAIDNRDAYEILNVKNYAKMQNGVKIEL